MMSNLKETSIKTMATRSVTNMYTLLRTNSIHNRGINSFKTSKYYNDYDSDSDECINNKSALMEADRAIDMRSQEICLPSWILLFEDAQNSLTWLKSQLEELNSSQHAIVLKPNLDDSQKKCTQDLALHITRVFASTKKTIDQIRLHSSGLSDNKESHLSLNVSSALMTKLKNVFSEFKNSLKTYSKSLEGTSLQTPCEIEDKSSSSDLQCINSDGSLDNVLEQQLKMPQLNRSENNKEAVQWEGVANQIASSIIELNNIFKDVAHVATQQGSVLDQIDHNIEQTVVELDLGAVEDIKSEKCYQSNLNMKYFIIFLFPISFLLLFFLM